MQNTNKLSFRVLLPGILLIFFGFIFLLQNFQLIYIGSLLSNFWPLILVAIGGWLIYNKKEVSVSSVKEVFEGFGDREFKNTIDELNDTRILGDV